MGARGHDAQAVRLRELDDGPPETNQLLPGLADVLAHRGPHLDDRLVELGLELIVEDHLAVLQDVGDVRRQLPAFGVDELIFLLDPDREGRLAHDGSSCQLFIVSESG